MILTEVLQQLTTKSGGVENGDGRKNIRDSKKRRTGARLLAYAGVGGAAHQYFPPQLIQCTATEPAGEMVQQPTRKILSD